MKAGVGAIHALSSAQMILPPLQRLCSPYAGQWMEAQGVLGARMHMHCRWKWPKTIDTLR